MRIRIKKTPPGLAPEWVRAAWVGIEMESTGKEDPKTLTDYDLLIGRREGKENLGGYKVYGEVAFKALQPVNQKAYDWWMKNRPRISHCELIFHTDVCEEIS